MNDARVIVGRLAGVYGVKGWVRVQSFTEPVENILGYGPWQVDRYGQVEIAEGKLHGKGLIVRLEGVVDRDQAKALMGRDISVDRSQLPALEQDEYYWSDLVGLTVENLQGETLGTVQQLVETGVHDVMVVKGDRERLVPYARGRVVQRVDLEARRIVVDWDASF